MLEICYQDEHLIAINKPAGLLVHRSEIARDVKEFAIQKLRDQIGKRVYLIHRLDRPTSGVLLFALHKEAAERMSLLFKERKVEKKYLALVRGYPEEKGEIDIPLRQDNNDELKPAFTAYERLAKVQLDIPVGRYPTARYSLLRLRPGTGRWHQIRRHLAKINYPIVGDQKHGDNEHNHLFVREFGITGLLLSAVRLSFEHPYSKERIDIKASPSPSLAKGIDVLGWKDAYQAISTSE